MADQRRRGRARRRQLVPGTRVRVVAVGAGLTLTDDRGLIARDDVWDQHYIVRLDQPARYEEADGSTVDLWEIRVAADNLEVLEVPIGQPLTPEQVELESLARVQETALRITRWGSVRLRDDRRAVLLFFDDERPDIRDLDRVHRLEGGGNTFTRWQFWTHREPGGGPVQAAFAIVWVHVLTPVTCRFHLAFDFTRNREMLYGITETRALVLKQWDPGVRAGTWGHGTVWEIGDDVAANIRRQLEWTAAASRDVLSSEEHIRRWQSGVVGTQTHVLV